MISSSLWKVFLNIFCAVTLASLTLTLPQVYSANLLTNPDFERGTGGMPDSWEYGAWNLGDATFQWEDAGACGGSRCVSIAIDESTADGNDAWWVQEVSLIPDEYYNLYGKIRGDNIRRLGEGDIGANVCRLDTWYTSGGGEDSVGTFDWKEFVVTLQAAPDDGKTKVAGRLGFWHSTVSGKAWFDSFYLVDEHERHDGQHVYLELESTDLDVISVDNLSRWLNHLDSAYEEYIDLVGFAPDDGAKIGVVSVRQNPGGWAVAGNPVRWHQPWVEAQLKSINDSDDWSFGILHELSHNFDLADWNFDAEHFANFKMYYALESLQGKVFQRNLPYIGTEIKEFYKRNCEEPGNEAYSDCTTYDFIRIRDEIGWEPFKKAFRAFQDPVLESAALTRVDKFYLFIDKLSEFSGRVVRHILGWDILNAIVVHLGGTEPPPHFVTASSYQELNVPEHTLDQNLSTRWSAQGDGEWLLYDLGSSIRVNQVSISWYQGDQRSADFDIEVSTDGTYWTPVYSGASSGMTLGLEAYAFEAAQTRYVRIVGHGNSRNDWNSITEVVIQPVAPLMAVTSVSTGEPYSLARAEVDAPIYIDRGYIITELSENLDGGVLIRTANEDKFVAAVDHLGIRVWRDAAIYVAYDMRGADILPLWLLDKTWIEADEVLSSTNIPASPMVVFRKNVSAGKNLILGGNHQGGDTGARSNYVVIGVEQPLVEIASISSGTPYFLGRAKLDARAYTDRNFTITDLTSGLEHGVLVRTANDDKFVTADEHLVLRVVRDAAVYVAYDRRGAATPPSWLSDGTWTVTSEVLSSTDNPASPMAVFRKDVAAGELLTLGGNHQGGDTGARSNYLVIAQPLVEIVSVSSGRPYALGRAERGALLYVDRGFTITDLTPGLGDGVLIQTANGDKFADVSDHLVLRFRRNATVYVGYDKRGGLPLWLENWTPEAGEFLTTTDVAASPMEILSMEVAAGDTLVPGGNHEGGDTGARSHYVVVMKP